MQNTKEIFLKNIERHNLSPSKLIMEALSNKEGVLSAIGAFAIFTGKYTGRSPKDRYIVANAEIEDEINWKNNQKLLKEQYESIYSIAYEYLKDKKLYTLTAKAGKGKESINFNIINEFATHNLFLQNMLKKVDAYDQIDFTLISIPNLLLDKEKHGINSEAIIAINFEKKEILIIGTKYCGEMKKAVFSVINYLYPKKNILTMHCSANIGAEGDTALFFGLSGTGKTTLSACFNRALLGDDEHAWDKDNIFNIENGCYAKCLDLSYEKEPSIFDAIKYGSIIENVVLDKEFRPNYFDSKYTQNTRASYPLSYIKNCSDIEFAKSPKNIFFLSADANGVFPPIAKLDKMQALYFFASGYTSVLAETERGTKAGSTFSTCYGAPFFPLRIDIYLKIFQKRLDKYNPNVYLVNTGWVGESLESGGKRIDLALTRKLVKRALNNEFRSFEKEKQFNLSVPSEINFNNSSQNYLEKAFKLKREFIENFEKLNLNIKNIY